jgi:phosphotransferase system enzyme I (PtsI)
MRHLLSGNAAARGSALGRARVRLPHALDVEETRITAADVDAELERIHEAVDIVRAEMHTLRQRLHGALAHEVGEFVDLHALLLDDPELLQGIDALIRTGLYSADYALRLQRDRIAAVFEGMDDAYLRSRIDDIDQVMGRLHAALHRREADLQGVAGEILVTDSIAPAELAQLQAQGVVGVVTAGGSPLSHSAILARSLHLPLVVGATQALLKVNDGDVLVIDGASGLVVLEPNAADLRAHHKRVIESKRERRELNRLRREPSRTLDGVDIKLWANAESRDDVAEAHALGAAGVGLYRTEFLFMGSSELPDEETQFRAYRDAVIGMTGRTVTIRTLDLGADKADKTGLALRDEPNPALGLRGVRLSLARDGCLRTQLRAMARASGYGPLRALVPMVSGYEEMRTVRRALDAVHARIAQRRPRGRRPRAAGRDDRSAVGGDLAAGLHRPLRFPVDRHQRPGPVPAGRRPHQRGAGRAVLAAAPGGAARAARRGARIANRRGKPVAVCGEIAGDPLFAPLLLALGIGELSLHPGDDAGSPARGARLRPVGPARGRASPVARTRPRRHRSLAEGARARVIAGARTGVNGPE